jgi:hypothetical protein
MMSSAKRQTAGSGNWILGNGARRLKRDAARAFRRNERSLLLRRFEAD